MRTTTSLILVFAAVLVIGCSKPAAPAESAGSPTSRSEVTPAEDATAGNRVVCTLACSATEAKGYGATEEEARADVKQYIRKNCKPEDGQYFIFCDPPT